MNRSFFFIRVIVLLAAGPGFVVGSVTEGGERSIYADPNRTVDERVIDLLYRLTLREKALFFSGKDMWHLEAIERLGIPSVRVTDCGHGVTVILDESGNNSGCATCFPTGVAQGATWNRELVRAVGKAIARETRATGSAVLLGPMVNIHRSPLGGRNYETFSEDPYLTGSLASAFIAGVQSEHVAACIKAMAANNQQTNQSQVSVEMSERVLREIYLPGFRIPVEQADPWAVMTSYNALNGEYTSANRHLITDILKGEWGYQGLVISDWRGVRGPESITAGLDLEMPGPGKYMRERDILAALENGLITYEEIDDRVKRFLRILIKTGLLDGEQPEQKSELNSIALKKLARTTAEESIVLLKNDGGLLPLYKYRIKKLAVLGPNANEARLGGGGSASVTPCYSVSPLQGIAEFAGTAVDVRFEEGCAFKGNMSAIPGRYLFTREGDETVKGLTAEFFNGSEPMGTPVFSRIDDKIDFSWGWAAPCGQVNRGEYSVRWTGWLEPPVSGRYKIGLTCREGGCRLYIDNELSIEAWGDPKNENFEAKYIQTSESVSIDMVAGQRCEISVEFHKKMNRNAIRLEWQIPGASSPIENAVRLAAECDAAVVFAGLSNLFEGGMNDKEDLFLPGEQEKLISRVAAVNPQTIVVIVSGTPVVMPWIDDIRAVLQAYYPGQEGGHAIAGLLLGNVNPSGKLPETFPKRLEDNPSFKYFPGDGDRVFYTEGLFVGYRHYDSRGIEPLFPFGHGLSYTEFEYSDLTVREIESGGIAVWFDVRNTGRLAGKETAQLYVRDVQSTVERPDRELKGFEKIGLNPGEKKTVHMVLPRETFSYFDPEKLRWVVEPGEFEILIGSSSRDIRLKRTIEVGI